MGRARGARWRGCTCPSLPVRNGNAGAVIDHTCNSSWEFLVAVPAPSTVCYSAIRQWWTCSMFLGTHVYNEFLPSPRQGTETPSQTRTYDRRMCFLVCSCLFVCLLCFHATKLSTFLQNFGSLQVMQMGHIPVTWLRPRFFAVTMLSAPFW